MQKIYNYTLLKKILTTKVGKIYVWKKRIKLQTQLLHILEESFGTDASSEAFGFYPNRIYFATSLTADSVYTQKMKPVWHKINTMLRRLGYDVYAPFDVTDPHQKLPDNLTSYQITQLDHVKVLQAEVALMDLNRAAHGVGQEIEMSIIMPTIAFSQTKVSRLSKGMSGMLLFSYKDEKELLKILKEIFIRESFTKQPFYLDNWPNHPVPSVWKGDECLNCTCAKYLHEM